jgi:hypothetical protein
MTSRLIPKPISGARNDFLRWRGAIWTEKAKICLKIPECCPLFSPVNRLKTTTAGLLLALWMPAASLCLMENAGWLTKNDGCCESQSSEMSPCCALASASYKMDDSGLATAPAAQPLVLLSDLANLNSVPQQFVRAAAWGVSPPELQSSWQFCARAAANPRAPSFVS